MKEVLKMTLVAAVKYNNQACIISDVRLTSIDSGLQYDVAEKFIFIENKLAIFSAGDFFVPR